MSKKYYICVTPFFPTPELFFGSYIYDQVKAIRSIGDYEVVVFRPAGSVTRLGDSYEFDGFKVHLFPTRNLPSNILMGCLDWYNSRSFMNAFSVSGIEPKDVVFVHCHTASCAIYGKTIKSRYPFCKTIIQYHDLDPIGILNGRFSDSFWNLYYKAYHTIKKIQTFDYHVSVSKRVEENLLYFPDVAKRETYKPYISKLVKLQGKVKHPIIKNSYVLYNGVDLKKFHKIDRRHKDGRFRIGCIGNYIAVKCHTILIDAVKILVDKGYDSIVLSLVGNNPQSEFEKIKAYVTEKCLESVVEFTPPFTHKELVKYYNTLDLFVLPSCFEGLGCVFTEAYACGVPFMSCLGQGIEDVIDSRERNLWLSPVNDTARLACNIENYYHTRRQQKLQEPYDINVLITSFLKYLNNTK